MKRLTDSSQYFLHSPKLVAELIGHSNIRKNDTVIDIGAGSGIIAGLLAGRCKQVLAYEPDTRLLPNLHKNLTKYSNIDVINKDFLNTELPTNNYKVFANIPFHLSSPIVQKLTNAANPPKSIYLIVQKQFAHKLLIDDRRFTGLLGAQIAPWFTVRIRRPLRKTDYMPRPAVDTVLVEIKLRETPLLLRNQQTAYQDIVARCYSTPTDFRKFAGSLLAQKPELKPSNLITQEWLAIFNQ